MTTLGDVARESSSRSSSTWSVLTPTASEMATAPFWATRLSDLLAAGHLPLGAAMRIARDVAAGLAEIHAANELHRDVCPHNVLVSIDGVARLGRANDLAGSRVTSTTIRKGVLAYASPEYIADGTFTTRSDMFAFGIVFWEMLAGRSLFRGPTETVSMERVVAAKVPPLDDVPRWISSVARKALARDPADRFTSMAELAGALAMAAPLASASRTSVAEVVTRLEPRH